MLITSKATTEYFDLEPIISRYNAATAAPWDTHFSYHIGRGIARIAGIGVRSRWRMIFWTNEITTLADAEFIANARQDIPALVEEIMRLRQTLADLDRQNT